MNVHRFLRPALLALLVLGLTGLSFGQFGVSISIGIAPPPLPVYEQPPIPAQGYVWTPGYWAWSDDGYYWVPGTWVQPPQVGLVWTPGYWGWNDDEGAYGWNDGYWGNEVGFYGGVDYGYGYPGDGYYGGYWQGNNFYYNSAVNNVRTVNITTVYTKEVPVAARAERVSYNGGEGGVQAKPQPKQIQERQHAAVKATPAQKEQVQVAAKNPQLFARNNNGKPPVAATAKPGDMKSAVPAKAAGGKVDPKVLQATSKTAPKSTKGATAAAGARNDNKPGSSASESKSGAANKPGSASNVPKPPSASGSEAGGSHARATEPSTARPEEKGRDSGSSAGMPQSEGAGSHRASEPPSRSSEPAAHNAEQPDHGAASHEKAAPAEKGSEKDKPSKDKEKPDKSEKPQ